MRPIFASNGDNEDRSDYQEISKQFAEHVEPECLIDVLTGSTEKYDEYKMYYEQISRYMKPEVHANIVDGFEIAETTRYNASKSEDVQNRSKEYIDNKKKGQSDKYDITGETLITDYLKYIKINMRSILTNRHSKNKELGDKTKHKNPKKARLTSIE